MRFDPVRNVLHVRLQGERGQYGDFSAHALLGGLAREIVVGETKWGAVAARSVVAAMFRVCEFGDPRHGEPLYTRIFPQQVLSGERWAQLQAGGPDRFGEFVWNLLCGVDASLAVERSFSLSEEHLDAIDQVETNATWGALRYGSDGTALSATDGRVGVVSIFHRFDPESEGTVTFDQWYAGVNFLAPQAIPERVHAFPNGFQYPVRKALDARAVRAGEGIEWDAHAQSSVSPSCGEMCADVSMAALDCVV
jgi:hypothetical protein